MEYSFSMSPGVITAFGVPDNTRQITGAAPQPSGRGFFGNLTDLIKATGEAIRDIRQPEPGIQIPNQAGAAGTAVVVPMNTSMKALLVGVLVVAVVILVVFLLK